MDAEYFTAEATRSSSLFHTHSIIIQTNVQSVNLHTLTYIQNVCRLMYVGPVARGLETPTGGLDCCGVLIGPPTRGHEIAVSQSNQFRFLSTILDASFFHTWP